MERTDLEQWKAREVARLLALVETERRYYQEMVAMLPVALVVLSADRSISSANRAFRQTFGLRAKDLRGKSIDQILPSDRLIEKIREVHTTGAAFTGFPLEFNGREFSLGITPIRNWDDESELETLITVQDAGEATIASRRGLPVRESFTGIPAVIWEADAVSLEFRWVRGDLGTVLGYPPDHWTGIPNFFEERIHSEDRAETMEFYRAAILRGQGDGSAEFRGVTAAGGTAWMREVIRVKGATVTGVMTPIGLRKQLEDQLLNSSRADALSGIASKLAHDLNNPLMIVNGYAEEMKSALRKDDPMRGDVDEILTATDRIAGIAAQLLNYTRRQAQAPAPVNVTQTVAALGEKIAQAAGKGCEVQIGAGEAQWAMADQAQLEEVILALVSPNREDASDRRYVTISCELDVITEHLPGATLAPGNYTRVTVQDDGRGMDEAHRAAAFEGILSKQGGDGSATALARAYAIVREWGGDIALFSEQFRGSTFMIYLPYYPAPVEPDAPKELLQATVSKPAEIVRETILLVEDEAGIRALVRKILRRENYNVMEAGSAEEAITLANGAGGRIDLLVTDVMLPAASGRELAERIREGRPELKVLYISGYTDDDAVRTGVIPAGSKFLQKPFTLGALIGKVKESLAN